ncbi:RNA-binding motif protein, X chromosome-like [Sciurus carolinensis]|uniref:RNA-binding motif protein, X chromosome-like n=1 Tax=Sciurus carolinensis TaxID=30640 RepID=UPI001FB4E10B|nr:RNA-binding motif protein, X chromosome-like [Sciurus carolinensis]
MLSAAGTRSAGVGRSGQHSTRSARPAAGRGLTRGAGRAGGARANQSGAAGPAPPRPAPPRSSGGGAPRGSRRTPPCPQQGGAPVPRGTPERGALSSPGDSTNSARAETCWNKEVPAAMDRPALCFPPPLDCAFRKEPVESGSL